MNRVGPTSDTFFSDNFLAAYHRRVSFDSLFDTDSIHVHFDPFFKILGPRQQRQSATCATQRQKASFALFQTQSFLSYSLLDMPI